MRWDRVRFGPWRTRIAWFPKTFGETVIWLEQYETREVSRWGREYRLPGSSEIYTNFIA